MRLINGKETSLEIQAEIAEQVRLRKSEGHRAPHLAAIVVGDNPASQVYVGHKIKACERVGFNSTLVRLGANIRQEQLIDEIQALNANQDIDGFIVQLPLPKGFDEQAVIEAVAPEKDVDGFHPMHAGSLMLGLPGFAPATPAGIMELVKRHRIETRGKHVVVVGRSHIVGSPISIMMSRPGVDATVTLCHSRTQDLSQHTRNADILIAAVGIPRFITGDMIKPGAVVIDVGINSIDDFTRKSGTRLVGDVDAEGAAQVAGALTPVPGGVGPMTIAALLVNTMKASLNELTAIES